MDGSEATRLCREVWRALGATEDRIRRVLAGPQARLSKSVSKAVVPAAGVKAVKVSKAPTVQGDDASRVDEAIEKVKKSVAIRGEALAKIFRAKRRITEEDWRVTVRSKLRMSQGAISDAEISDIFRAVDGKAKKWIPATVMMAVLFSDQQNESQKTHPGMDPIEALRWKRMELARDLERLQVKA